MCLFVVGDVLGSVVDLTATEELLSVGVGVEDNTESSSHIDGLSVGVEVNVLTRVSAPVTVHVLKSILLIGRGGVDGRVYMIKR